MYKNCKIYIILYAARYFLLGRKKGSKKINKYDIYLIFNYYVYKLFVTNNIDNR